MHMQRQPVSDEEGKNDAVTNATDLPSPMEIGVNPPKAAQDEAGYCIAGNFRMVQILAYFEQIQIVQKLESMKFFA